jgi:predicted phage terminase large subunit-like protein
LTNSIAKSKTEIVAATVEEHIALVQQKRREKVKLGVARKRCEKSHLDFTRYFFKQRQGIKFRINWHHILIARELEKVIKGETENLVINVPPGSSKTELAVINFIARGLALNPRARFLHLSGSDQLALLNSETARDIVTSDHYQAFWPLKIADDADSKKRWNIEINGQKAGGVYAVALGGQVTGFRAGHMAEGFQGAVIIDDPIKPEDAFNKAALNKANRRLVTTVKSRRANPKTPIVVIMQRVGEGDTTDFIKAGHLDGNWKFVAIPAIITKEKIKELAPDLVELADSTEVDDKGRFSYWPYKEPLKELAKMESGHGVTAEGARISRFVFASQYDQNPKSLGGNLIKGQMFFRFRMDVLPKIIYRKVYADTAQKTKEHNDYSVFLEAGYGEDGKAYPLALIRDKWESPELKRRATAFWAMAKNRDVAKFGQLREMAVEDKSSGTDLIQTLKLPPYNIPVKEIQRNKDKVTRALDALPYIDVGLVGVPEDAPFTNDFVAECEAFSADMSHAHDDQVDVLLDMVMDLLSSGNKLKVWENLGKQSEAAKELDRATQIGQKSQAGWKTVQDRNAGREDQENSLATKLGITIL